MSRRRLRILYVGTLPPHQGGSAIMAAQLLAGLAASGHGIEAISPITEQALSGGDAFGERNPAIAISRFTMPYLDTSPDSPPTPVYLRRERTQIERLFERSVARRRADVVIIGRESFAPHVVDLARSNRATTLLLFQGSTTMGILNGTYPKAEASRLVGHFRRADAAVTCAEHMRDAVTQFGVSDVKVIPNPVDLQRFRPMNPSSALRHSLGIGEQDIVVMHLSNLKSLKRAHDFVQAAALIASEERRLSFVVVGAGPCRRELEELSAAVGLSERIRFTGWVDHARIPEVINCADIIALPSAAEAQALAYLEAQACQRTLVASDIPAAREVIDHGRTGLLHRTADASDLAAKLLTAALDKALRARIGRQAREVVGKHALPRVISLYAELLRAITGSTHCH